MNLGVGETMLPLTEAYFYILLALYQEPLHGYRIMQDVEDMTAGRVHIGPGTLYTALNTLVKKGLIRPEESQDPEDARRKAYRITEEGKETLEAEMARLEELLRNGRERTQGRAVQGCKGR